VSPETAHQPRPELPLRTQEVDVVRPHIVLSHGRDGPLEGRVSEVVRKFYCELAPHAIRGSDVQSPTLIDSFFGATYSTELDPASQIQAS
jgi:hypothetical protein